MKKFFSLLLMLNITIILSSCSDKTNTFTMEDRTVLKSSHIVDSVIIMQDKNNHNDNTYIPFSLFVVILSGQSNMYRLDEIGYATLSDINADNEYVYETHHCHKEETLDCYSMFEDTAELPNQLESIPFSDVLRYINEYEFLDIVNVSIDVFGTVDIRETSILIYIEHYNNEIRELSDFECLYVDDGNIITNEEIVMDGYYVKYVIGSNTKIGIVHNYVYVEVE
jgi:hypothetical protein